MPSLSLNGNYIDLIILLILGYFIIESIKHGLLVFVSDLLSFGIALGASVLLFKYPAELLKANFSLPDSFANVIGFIILAAIIEMSLGYIFAHIIAKLPERYWKSWVNRFLGIIPGLLEGMLIVLFFATVALAVPLKPQIQNDIEESKIGGIFLRYGGFMNSAVNRVFGGVIEDSITYLTVKPDSDERIDIEVTKLNLKEDEESGKMMLEMINEERAKEGIGELEWSEGLVEVGEEHAKDMWERKYFGHISPEGKSVKDRVTEARIGFFYVGENLALAPTVKIAHKGLMESEGHRENILEKRFKKVGIGVVDNGRDGKIFVQIFTN